MSGITSNALTPSSTFRSSLLSPSTYPLLHYCLRLPHSINAFSGFFWSCPRWSCPQLPPEVLQFSEPCALCPELFSILGPPSSCLSSVLLLPALPGKALPVFTAQLQQTLPGASSDAQSGAAHPNICLYFMKDTCLISCVLKLGWFCFLIYKPGHLDWSTLEGPLGQNVHSLKAGLSLKFWDIRFQ